MLAAEATAKPSPSGGTEEAARRAERARNAQAEGEKKSPKAKRKKPKK
ncbi:hypothetical protein ACG5V6_03180 [Streptomyces chitinivorans]|uniref:Uncharacterized protein n=1 Tax=Streptomyces chitinivorans TaxID=1257027 RepID=A0ABW7HMX4_9ACTN